MALFEVYVMSPSGTAVGWMVTQSREKASAEAEKISKKGRESWYEQIQ